MLLNESCAIRSQRIISSAKKMRGLRTKYQSEEANHDASRTSNEHL